MVTINRLLVETFGTSTAYALVMAIRVLVIDDEDDIRTAICEYLQSEGFVTDGVGEREEAESLMTHIGYDLIITDLVLTRFGCQGIDLLRFAAGLEQPPKTIVLTGHGDSLHQQEAKMCGASAFLGKPVPLELLTTVARDLATRRPVSHRL